MNAHDKQVGATAVEGYKAEQEAKANDTVAQGNEDQLNVIIEVLGRIKGDQFKGTLEQVMFNRNLERTEEIAEEEYLDLDLGKIEVTIANMRRLNTADSIDLADRLERDIAHMSNNTLL